jgi:hypothetical protein
VVLLGVGKDRALRAQANAGARGLAVLTDHDASAIVLTAATLVSLSQQGRGVDRARVLIAGGNRSPVLSGLLTEAGIRDMTLWEAKDAAIYPLSWLVGSVDVVLDLLEGGPRAAGPAAAKVWDNAGGDNTDVGESTPGDAAPLLGQMSGGRAVFVTPDPVRDVALVLPALVHAICVFPSLVTDFAGFALAYHAMSYACALELVMATPRSQTSLPGPGQELSVRLANGAIRALPAALRQPSRQLKANGNRPGASNRWPTQNS